MYELIGYNYERSSKHLDIIRRKDRTKESLEEIYNHAEVLLNSGECSKYLLVLVFNGNVVDYNRVDYWYQTKKAKAMFLEETNHYPSWDYSSGICPYQDRPHHEGESKEYMERRCSAFESVMKDDGIVFA